MFTINTEIEINAPVEQVWQVISDFKNYKSWNTQLYFLSGKAELGERLEVKLEPMGHKGYTFKPVVNDLQQGKKLSWKGSIYRGGLYQVQHEFLLYQSGRSGTKLINRELCKGILCPIIQHLPITKNAKASFDWLNEEIREQAELLVENKIAS